MKASQKAAMMLKRAAQAAIKFAKVAFKATVEAVKATIAILKETIAICRTCREGSSSAGEVPGRDREVRFVLCR